MFDLAHQPAMETGLTDQEGAFSLTDSLTDTACYSFISVQGWAPMVRVNSLCQREKGWPPKPSIRVRLPALAPIGKPSTLGRMNQSQRLVSESTVDCKVRGVGRDHFRLREYFSQPHDGSIAKIHLWVFGR